MFEDVAYLASCKPRPRRLKGIIAISNSILESLIASPELKDIPVFRLFDAFKSPKFHYCKSTRDKLIACVGRVTPSKGQFLVLQALQELDCLREVTCWIIGDGDPGYIDILTSLNVPNVVWHGFSNNVADLLARCNVLVCPTDKEALGRVIFEAWIAGAVPVVFAGSGGAAEVVSAADAGLLYAEQTPAALGQAIAAALALPPAEHARLIANCRAWLQANCSPQHYGQAITRVFEQACRL